MGTPVDSFEGLEPWFAERAGVLMWLLAAWGFPATVTSGYRSTQRQAELYAKRGSNRFPVAPPGRSYHEYGRAVDLHSKAPNWLRRLAAAWSGIDWKSTDRVHFQA